MKRFCKSLFPLLLLCGMVLGACTKDVTETGTPPAPPPPPTPAPTVLKEAAAFPVGVAISYTPMLNDARYAPLVKAEFDAVTFDYHMKHGAVVQNNGSFDFSRTDALVNAAAGLQIFGHTLGWHQNQNASYLKNFAGLIATAGPELLTNQGFENGLTGWSVFNSGDPSGTATVTAGSGSSEVRSGNGSLKVVNPTAYAGNQ